MPKKPQHLSLASSVAGGSVSGNGNGNGNGNGSKPKYSLTLHNNKHAQGGGKNPQAATLREGHQQRQHLKALRLMREAGEPGGAGGAAEAADYRRHNGGTGLSPAEEAVGVHLKACAKSATANGEASSNMTKSGNGSTGMANGAMRAQNNRLWYH
ncbi:hypothetical protein KR200_006460 [Drosophila serrata]|nr:hypothetical protein KR200_006460 [Drosophila serrata]